MITIEDIKNKVMSLKSAVVPGHFEYIVGKYVLHIYTYSPEEPTDYKSTSLTDHNMVHVILTEITSDMPINISLTKHDLFKDYKPIQYKILTTPSGAMLNFSNGDCMPITVMYDLIKYLYKLENLTPFF